MKKIFYSMFAMAMTAMTFVSCDDVPAPYDIAGNGGNGGGDATLQTIYSENFDEGTSYFEYKSVSGYANVWSVKTNNGKGYLNASAYANSKSNAAEAWAYSPAINLSDSKAATLSFRHAINKITDKTAIPERMTVWVSTDKTNWTQLTVPTYPTGDSWTFVGSGDIDLTAYCGQEKVYIGFKYISIDGDAGTWEIDEFTITGDGTPMTTPEKPDTPSNFEAGQYFFVYKNGAESKACEFKPANATANYGYLNPTTTTTITSEGVLTDAEANLFTFTAVEGGFTIQKSTGEYLFVEGTYKSFQLSAELPSSNYIWAVNVDENGLATITNTGNNFVIRFSTHNNFAPTNATTGDLPMLVKQGGKIDVTGGTTGGGTGGGTGNSGTTVSALTNGDFETWEDNLPTGWKSASTASSATLEQSTDAHGGSYSVCVKGDTNSNKRLASKEITLEAGSYTFTFWVKPTTSNKAQVRPAYVAVVDNAVSGSYQYGDYATLSEGWQKITYNFTLTAETTICLVVMNPKKSNYSSGEDVLIDDAVLTKN